MVSENIIYHESAKIKKRKEIKNFVVLIFHVFVIDAFI